MFHRTQKINVFILMAALLQECDQTDDAENTIYKPQVTGVNNNE